MRCVLAGVRLTLGAPAIEARLAQKGKGENGVSAVKALLNCHELFIFQMPVSALTTRRAFSLQHHSLQRCYF